MLTFHRVRRGSPIDTRTLLQTIQAHHEDRGEGMKRRKVGNVDFELSGLDGAESVDLKFEFFVLIHLLEWVETFA